MDKTWIERMNDKCDYSLRKLRVYAAITAIELEMVFQVKKYNGNGSCLHGVELEGKPEQCQQASNIIVLEFGDHASRAVRLVSGKPFLMLKLND